jgi:hypothetical protein
MMGRLLHGKFELEIIDLRPPLNPADKNPEDFTARYNARVIKSAEKDMHPDDIVSLRMVHYDHARNYFGRISDMFDGDVNDIQDDPDSKIDISRSYHITETYTNPFGP